MKSPPARDVMIAKLQEVYANSFSGGRSVIRNSGQPKKKPSLPTSDPRGKALIYWSPKDFVHYFALLYYSRFDMKYQISYESDLRTINDLGRHFKSMGFDYRYHLQAMIDWALDNSDAIMEKRTYLTLQTIKTFANEYLQSKVLGAGRPASEENYDFVASLDSLYLAGKMSVALRRYGIPIVASYLHYARGHDLPQIFDGLCGLTASEEDWSKIAKASIIRSPYPDCILMADWRLSLGAKVGAFSNESWWRDVDYLGLPFKAYTALCQQT